MQVLAMRMPTNYIPAPGLVLGHCPSQRLRYNIYTTDMKIQYVFGFYVVFVILMGFVLAL